MQSGRSIDIRPTNERCVSTMSIQLIREVTQLTYRATIEPCQNYFNVMNMVLKKYRLLYLEHESVSIFLSAQYVHNNPWDNILINPFSFHSYLILNMAKTTTTIQMYCDNFIIQTHAL